MQSDGHHVVAALHRCMGEGHAEPDGVRGAAGQFGVGPPIHLGERVDGARAEFLEKHLALIIPSHAACRHVADGILDGVIRIRAAARVEADHGIKDIFPALVLAAMGLAPHLVDEGAAITRGFPKILPDQPGIIVIAPVRQRQERLGADPAGAGIAVIKLQHQPVGGGLMPHAIVRRVIESTGVDERGVTILMRRGTRRRIIGQVGWR